MESDSGIVASPNPPVTFTDPISGFFGGIFFIIVLVLILIFVVILMFAKGVSWVANKAAGDTTKQKFTNPPVPMYESDERCATFPQI